MINVNIEQAPRLTLGTAVEMAKVNRLLSPEDIHISIKGSVLSYPDQLTITLENTRYVDDSANLSIDICLQNLFTGEYIDGPYGSTSHWVFSEEIEESWKFTLSSHAFKRFELLRLNVVIKGYHDDIGLYTERHSSGVVGKSFLLLLPKF